MKAAAAIKRPFGDMAAIVFLSWLVSTFPNIFPVFPCQSMISVPARYEENQDKISYTGKQVRTMICSMHQKF